MVAVIDYGVGNLFSLISSLNNLKCEACVTSDISLIKKADRIILPGVGAFEDAANKLFKSGIAESLISIANDGIPVLGICLGMQLLFEKSYEYGIHDGLSLIPGDVRPISEVIPDNLKIPHMGWNSLKFVNDKHPLFKYINEGDFVYFVHSYSARNCNKNTIASTEYGVDLTASVAKDNVMGCQFHPEKSGKIGLKILQSFCEMKRGNIC
ncbi:MAG: imidazole glycerol phosphate synthase subunit HisH [Clostridia bacterium]|nr:imidazole glycerol phosphate synthase subunit HisH [Clostridia bacterium]